LSGCLNRLLPAHNKNRPGCLTEAAFPCLVGELELEEKPGYRTTVKNGLKSTIVVSGESGRGRHGGAVQIRLLTSIESGFA
jgi:hypothetical protein